MARKNAKKKANPNTMWGGRYSLGPAEIMEKINASIGFDRKLYAQDIAGSLAHADKLVAQAAAKGVDLDKLSLKEMQAVEPRITKGVYRVLTVEASVAARKSFGGTAPANVARAVKDARKRYL